NGSPLPPGEGQGEGICETFRTLARLREDPSATCDKRGTRLLGDADAVLARQLDGVHRLVGGSQQSGGLLRVLGKGGDAGAGGSSGDVDGGAVDARRGGDGGAQRLRHGDAGAERTVGQNDGELIAAEARRKVARAELAGHELAEVRQRLTADQ